MVLSTGAWIFEDDYDSEYRYAGRPVPALQGFDHRGAGDLLRELQQGRHASVLDQAAMCEFMTAGHFGRHIRRTRELYASRLMALREAMRRRLAGIIDLPPSEAGRHVAAWLRPGLRADPIAAAAAAKNVALVPIRRFVLRTPRPEGFLLGFAPFTPQQIR